MTLTLHLTPDQEAEARARAARNDPDADAYLAALMRYALDVYTPEECDPPPGPGESVYDSIKDYIGKYSSDEETAYSENTGEKFTEYLVEKKRQGRL